jgi:hypothetical protein
VYRSGCKILPFLQGQETLPYVPQQCTGFVHKCRLICSTVLDVLHLASEELNVVQAFGRRDVLQMAVMVLGASSASSIANPESCVKSDGNDAELRKFLHYVTVSKNPAQKCSTCGFFSNPQNACGKCAIFDSQTDADGDCDSWAPLT